MNRVTTNRKPDEASRLRVPPHSMEAEQSVLGGLLLDNMVFDRVAAMISEEDFYRYEHQLLWSAIAALVNAGKPADVITVFETLDRQQLGEDAGGMPYINALAQSVPSAANITRYAEIVRERSALRRTVGVGDEIASEAFKAQAAAPVLERGIRRLEEIEARGTPAKMPRRIGKVLVQCLDRLQAMADGTVEPGWSIGLPRTDAALGGGFKPGKVVVLAARPSVGKSSLGQAVIAHIAKTDQHCAVLELSQEMPDVECGNRAIANLGRVDYGRLETGKLVDDDWGRVADAVDLAKGLDWYIDDQPGLRLVDIRLKARHVAKEAKAAGKKLGVMMIDYVQLCASDESLSNRNLEIESISRGLKVLAKELGICILLLSQLNREVDKRPGLEPIMSDLRDSGAIEADADVIWFLWPIGEADGFGNRTVGSKLAKNRQGELLRMCLHFEGRMQRWGESTYDPDAAMFAAAKAKKAIAKGAEV